MANEVNSAVLRQVQCDNQEAHQFGAENDGISEETAQQIGFMTTDQLAGVITEVDARPKAPSQAQLIRQQQRNAQRHIAEHLDRTNKQVIDPGYN